MRTMTVAALAACLVATGVSAAPKSEAVAVATGFFTATDFAVAVKSCAPDAIVIDDFAPHVWSGKDACGAWLAAFGEHSKKDGMTPGPLTVGKPYRATVTGSDAYVTLPATFNYTRDGKAMVNKATATVALHKGKTGWLITGWSWGQTS